MQQLGQAQWGDILGKLVGQVASYAPSLVSSYQQAQHVIDTSDNNAQKAQAVLDQVRIAEQALKARVEQERMETAEVTGDITKFGLILGAGIVGFIAFQAMEKKRKR